MSDTNPTPQPGDFKRAGALLAGWATGDITAVHVAIQEAREANRSFHLIAALAESNTRAFNLRDPERLAMLRNDIAKYALKENNQR